MVKGYWCVKRTLQIKPMPANNDEYKRLGKDQKNRCRNYRELFKCHIDVNDIHLIRNKAQQRVRSCYLLFSIQQYRTFVANGRNQPKPWKDLKNQIYLGDDNFVGEMQCKILPDTNLSEVPSSQKRQLAKPLTYYETKYKGRNTAISKAYDSGGYSLKEIGDYYNLHYSWASRIVKAKSKTCP
jgi:hypothetical protein